MEKKRMYLLLVLGFILTLFLGCFNEKQGDQAKGVDVKRVGNMVSVIAKEGIAGAVINVKGNELSENQITVENGILNIVKNENGVLSVSVVKIQQSFIAGDELFVINTAENISIELKDENKIKSQEEAQIVNQVSKRATSDALLGDYNNDGEVTLLDFAIFKDKYGEASKYSASYDIAPASLGTSVWASIYSRCVPDGKINIIDFIIFASNFGKKNPIILPTSISIIGGDFGLAPGEAKTLIVDIKPVDAVDKTVTWTSSSIATATIEPTGKVTAVAKGITIITAKTVNNLTTSVVVTVDTVTIPVESVSIVEGNKSINIDASFTYTATVLPANATNKTVTWTSSSTAIATVDQNGKVTGVTAGTTTITAKAGDKTSQVQVTVLPNVIAVESVTIVEAAKTIKVAEVTTYTTTVLPANASDKTVTWSSDKPSVAIVVGGKVTGIATGTAIITATAGGKSSTVTVTVTEDVIPLDFGKMHPATGVYSPVDESTWGSAKYTLGSNYNGTDLEIGLFSANATKVLLEIYDTAFGADAKYDYWMTKGSDNVWRAKINGVPANTFYGFRVWGPNWPFNVDFKRGNSTAGFISDVDGSGNRFNPNKVVYDPYAKELSHDDESVKLLDAGFNGEVYASGSVLYKTKPRREWDTGKYVPKGIVIKDTTPTGTKPAIPKSKAMIYEAHVRALTKSDTTGNLSTILGGMSEFAGIQDIPVDERGTYLGAGKMAKYLKGLGLNAIEFLPVHECFNNETNDYKPNSNEIIGQENFWGYMTANFFSPERRYAKDQSPGGPTREFKQMVKMFHDEGIEVYLDVVYNHTGEGGLWEETDTGTVKIVSFRGIDNSAYYQLVAGNAKYQNNSGCGNNFSAANSGVAGQLVKDSLNYWIDDMGVDGFRFDLAPVLGRNGAGFDFNAEAQLLKDIDAIGNSKNVEMIAEAWDLGAYVLTKFPGNWSDWNGKFRDGARSAVNGGGWPALDGLMDGSAKHGYNTSLPESVNFITAHDGLTMMDVVSYDNGGYQDGPRTLGKITYYANPTNMGLTWPFGPSDGGSTGNVSNSTGGDQSARRQKLRNLWTIMFMAKGIPMALYGDEFGRTQNGNNNTYNVDSPATWSNYAMINTDSPNKVAIPGGIYHDNFGTDTKVDTKNGLFTFVKDLIKIRRDVDALTNPATVYSNWASADAWATTGSFTIGDKIHVMINMGGSAKTFTVPGTGWKRVVDTGAWAEKEGNIWPVATGFAVNGSYEVGANTITVLQK